MDEIRRLATLRSYGILDTPNEPMFDAVVRQMAQAFAVEAALVSFIDADRQWYKARIGIATTQVQRAISFCTHCIERDGVTVVTDSQLAPKFRDKPAAMAPDGVRFYAGAPITASNGARIGTVCVFDPQPRDDLTSVQRDQLLEFAARVMRLVERRRSVAARAAA